MCNMRLDKYLTNTNIEEISNIIPNRSKVKTLIKHGLISVNGKVVKQDNYQVFEKDEIKYQNQVLVYEEYIYLMMNKPVGYVSATQDNYHKTVLDLINQYHGRNFRLVGRLDVDTEGLIIITDDGDFIHQVTSPKSNIIKKYYVEYDGELVDNAKELVERGIVLDNQEMTKPGALEVIDNNKAYIMISEGKFHEVKKIFLSLGAKVVKLKRVKIGQLELDKTLKVGEYRKLSKDELELIKA